MPRRRPSLGIAPVVAGLAPRPADDDTTTAVLDAAATLLTAHGLHRWSMEDVADAAGVSRTSVYRRFANRDDLVHGVLARELRDTLAAIEAAAGAADSLEGKVIEGGLVALAALRGSLVEKLLQADPATFLPFLTTRAGPLVAIARQALVAGARRAGVDADEQQLAEAAEVAARLGLSLIVTRETAFPVDDPDELRASMVRFVGPMLAALTGA
jgi:TetR/AcrR family transcriptional repressor of uid operon